MLRFNERALDSFWWTALLVTVLRAIGGPIALLAFIVIIFYGRRGLRETFEALLLCWYVLLANEALFGSIPGGSAVRFLVVGLLAVNILPILFSDQGNKMANATLLFGVLIVIHSIFFSTFPVISVLKGITWTLTLLIAILTIGSSSPEQRYILEEHFYHFLVVIVFLSVLTYFVVPAASLLPYDYMRGILGHSQASGVVAASVALIAFTKLTTATRIPITHGCVFVVSIVAVFLTGARTGLLSVPFAIIGGLMILKLRKKSVVSKSGRSYIVLIFFAALLTLAFAVAFFPGRLSENLDDFLGKGTGPQTMLSAYEMSRGQLIDEMTQNIRADPVFGIGFGVASVPAEMKVDFVLGFPISAAVEKGVAWLAIWEEVGAVGIVFLIVWLLVIFSRVLRYRTEYLPLFVGIILQNFGEATIFSAGGMGMLQMLAIGFLTSKPGRAPQRCHLGG